MTEVESIEFYVEEKIVLGSDVSVPQEMLPGLGSVTHAAKQQFSCSEMQGCILCNTDSDEHWAFTAADRKRFSDICLSVPYGWKE